MIIVLIIVSLQALHVFVFCFTIYFSCRNGQTRRRVMKTYERHQDRHSHTDSTYPHYHKLYKPFMNDCMSEIEIDVLVPKMLFSFPCPNIWFRRRSIKMVGQHKCAVARKAVIRYAIITEMLMMGKIEISSTAWFVSLNRDKKSRILVHWSLSHDLIPIRSRVRMLLWWLLRTRCILYIEYVVVLWTCLELKSSL